MHCMRLYSSHKCMMEFDFPTIPRWKVLKVLATRRCLCGCEPVATFATFAPVCREWNPSRGKYDTNGNTSELKRSSAYPLGFGREAVRNLESAESWGGLMAASPASCLHVCALGSSLHAVQGPAAA